MSNMIGKVIDNYRILDLLGRGGMGAVYRAVDESLDRVIAMKMLDPLLADDPEILRRFLREPKLQAQLEHPNIVRIHAFRRTKAGLFIVMEYIDGITLTEKIKQVGLIPLNEVMSIVKQTCAAIGHAHRVHIIHRDIKPGNILIDKAGKVKVTDFGLAKLVLTGNTTITHSITGTVQYMPPEQIKGLSNADHRSDIYSFGMTFHEMLTGQLPFKDGENEYVVLKTIIEEEFPSPAEINPNVPAPLSDIVMRATAKKRKERYQSIVELEADIDRFISGSGMVPEAPTVSSFTETMVSKPLPLRPDEPTRTRTFHGPDPLPGTGEEHTRDQSRRAPVTTAVPDSRLSRPDKVSTLEQLTGSSSSKSWIWLLIIALGIIALAFIAVTAWLDSRQLEPQLQPPLLTGSRPESAAAIISNTVFSALEITSTPEQATVWINDRKMGTTPFLLDSLAAESYRIRLAKSGYSDWEEIITLADGVHQSISAPLKRLPPAQLMITPGPETRVFLDGKPLDGAGAPTMTVSTTGGRHALLVEHPRSGRRTFNLDLRAGERRTLKCYFESIVSIQSLNENGQDQWAAIMLNGKSINQTTPYANLRLPVGKHLVSVYRSGYDTAEGARQVIVEPDTIIQRHSIVFTLRHK